MSVLDRGTHKRWVSDAVQSDAVTGDAELCDASARDVPWNEFQSTHSVAHYFVDDGAKL